MRLASLGLSLLGSGVLVACGGLSFGLESVIDDDLTLPPISHSLEGETYLLDFADVATSTPLGLANLLTVVDGDGILVHVRSEGSVSLEMVLALSDTTGSQSVCEPVHPLPDADWTNPVFVSGPKVAEFSLGGSPAFVEDFSFAGTFADDGEGIEDFELGGVVDVRHLTSETLGEGDVCALVEQIGGECLPCSDGEMTCVEMAIGVAYAERVDIDFDPVLDTSGC